MYFRNPYDRVLARSATSLITGCIEWTGPVNGDGYARIYDYRARRYVPIHRLAYEERVGPIPDGLTIDHLCRNTRCSNPGHLEPVTIQENLARKPPQSHCKRGHTLSGDNVYVYSGARYCRSCLRQRKAEQRAVARRGRVTTTVFRCCGRPKDETNTVYRINGGKRVARCHACELRRSRASKRTGRERVVGAEAAKVLDR